jgi:hypothetical protein
LSLFSFFSHPPLFFLVLYPHMNKVACFN